MSKLPILRILAFDISLSSPGVAVVSIKDRKATIEAVSHTKTDANDHYSVRGSQIEHWAHLFAREHRKKGYGVIIREAYAGSFGHHSMYTGWIAVDRGLHYLALDFTEKAIAQQSVKKDVVGKGKAEKEEVALAVRALTGYTGEFASNDESDAVAVALSYAIKAGLIDPLVAPKPKRGTTK